MKNNKKPRIAFLGPLPPPIGGYSIGLQRLVEKLKEMGYDYVVYDLLNKKETRLTGFRRKIRSRMLWALKYFFFAKEDLICCYHIDWRIRCLTGLMSLLGKKTIISIGGQGLQDAYDQGNWLKKKMIAFSLARYSFIFAHNQVIRDFCLSLGVRSDRIELIYGFIPPLVKNIEINQIPDTIWYFIHTHGPVISANAFKIVFCKNEDLYGIDLCIELCARLKNYFPNIGFIFCLPSIGDYDYFREMQQRIKDYRIENNFRFITDSFQFYPILMESHVFLRPTNTDGDANSLREALYFKIPSVASDVFPRPEGTVLFKNRDINDLTNNVKEVLDNYEIYKKQMYTIPTDDNFIKLINVYQKMIGLTKMKCK